MLLPPTMPRLTFMECGRFLPWFEGPAAGIWWWARKLARRIVLFLSGRLFFFRSLALIAFNLRGPFPPGQQFPGPHVEGLGKKQERAQLGICAGQLQVEDSLLRQTSELRQPIGCHLLGLADFLQTFGEVR